MKLKSLSGFLLVNLFAFFFVLNTGWAQEFKTENLVIKTESKKIEFTIELADTPETRRVGLMHRTELPKDQGMLFDYNYPYVAAMWMKNTLIPLDMLFIRKDGTIAYIHHRAKPHDLSEITAGEPVRAVLELAGGVAKQQKIRVGHKVLHPIFKTSP